MKTEVSSKKRNKSAKIIENVNKQCSKQRMHNVYIERNQCNDRKQCESERKWLISIEKESLICEKYQKKKCEEVSVEKQYESRNVRNQRSLWRKKWKSKYYQWWENSNQYVKITSEKSEEEKKVCWYEMRKLNEKKKK